jgi:hypothetical protein
MWVPRPRFLSADSARVPLQPQPQSSGDVVALALIGGAQFRRRLGTDLNVRALIAKFSQPRRKGFSAMKNIVSKTGEVIAKTTDEGTLIGGHHRLTVAASIGQPLFWQESGQAVNLEAFFRHLGSFQWRSA